MTERIATRHDGAHSPAATVRAVLLGLLAAGFFSVTWVANHLISLSGGHWAWSASLRYVYVLLLLGGWIALRQGPGYLASLFVRFAERPGFWVACGGLANGVFFAGICFAADHAPGWVLATTWQLTIVISPLVLRGFGLKVPLRGLAFATLIFTGVVLVNLHSLAGGLGWREIALGVVPILVAAIAYPIGNQLLNRARNRQVLALGKRPADVFDDTAGSMFLMALGSIPFWAVLLLVTQPPAPSTGQLVNAFSIALSSGVIGTFLFLKARNATADAYAIAAVDATQAAEVVFTLVAEIALLGVAWPDLLGLAGMALVLAGLVGFMLRSGARQG